MTDRAARWAAHRVGKPRSVMRRLCVAVATVGASVAFANPCSVPSQSYPAIQDAVDDPACGEIVLAAQVFTESLTIARSVQIQGASSDATVIEGRVVLSGDDTEVNLQNLKVDGGGCYSVALDVRAGAKLFGQEDVVVVNDTVGDCPIFSDGFESGNTSEWSGTVPQ